MEGWHYRLNRKAVRGQLPLYLLVSLLWAEADFIDIQLRLISENQLRRYQRMSTKSTQGSLAQLWKDFENKRISITQLHRKVAHLSSVIPLKPSFLDDLTTEEQSEDQSEEQ